MLDQQSDDVPARPIAALEPEDFGRGALERGQLVEIRVQRDEGKAVIFGVLPERPVIGEFQSE